MLIASDLVIIIGMKLFVGNILCLSGGLNKVWLNVKKWKVEINQIGPQLEAYVTRKKPVLFVSRECEVYRLINRF